MKEILESREFKELVSKKNKVAFTLAFLEIVIYFGFILLLAFKKEVLGQTLGEGLTLGIPIGIAVIVISWILTGIYVYWANSVYDKAVEELKKKIWR